LPPEHIVTIELREITKRYGTTTVLHGVNLSVAKGEFLTLLGPTGCGKSTLLRILAGFVQPTSGEVRIDGKVINDLPPNQRQIGMLFQNYALFPHMTVEQNVGFGLKMRGASKAAIAAKVDEMLPMLGIAHLRSRYISQISGGQQQRTALARTLAIEPRVLLLDEPLAALDRRLRLEMQVELKKLVARVGITTICVSHDQDEALSMSDTIALIQDGRVEQRGSPLDLYDRPRTSFVASFLGNSNLLKGRIEDAGEAGSIFRSESFRLPLPGPVASGDATLLLRPEHLDVRLDAEQEPATGCLPGLVSFVTHFGHSIQYEVQLDAGPAFLVSLPRVRGAVSLPAGARVLLAPNSPSAYQLIHD
jgi:putative spermidine/putrescine transport system ATP-binding protein